jgi:acetyl esterase/lipase
MQIFAAYFLGFLSLLMAGLLFLRIKAPLGFMIWFPKLAAGALSPLWCILGICAAVLGGLARVPLAAAAGGIGAAALTWYIWMVTRTGKGFEQAFGRDWPRRISPQQSAPMLQRRWVGILQDPRGAEARLEKDLVFWRIPEADDRALLADLWQPPGGVAPSGVALIFLHGSAWYMLDKDYGTRPFFRHLTAQGHVVMDVAYRLCPEVDIYGMLGDVKRAVAWMKAHAAQYRVNPERILLGGASAGGHLSMLAAYAPHHPDLTPSELKGIDLSVRGVVSYYGPSDLRAVYAHTNQQRLVGLPRVPIGRASADQSSKKMRDAGRLDILLGGHPSEVPAAYALASPICHIHPGCPPTLLIQGAHDLITPLAATEAAYRELVKAGVPAVNVVFPCTDHGFDLLLPRISPTAQSALYEVERFMALLI